jgi:RimJ/RimL family protein N-acetyltransferase
VSIRLEPLAQQHLEALTALLHDEDARRYMRIPEPLPAGFAEAWLRSYDEARLAGTKEGFAIVDADGDAVLGIAVAPRIEAEARTAELGYAVAPAARGRGVATQALELLTRWALSELGALRLELLISTDNEASKRVAAACGYVREGVLRSLYFKQGRRQDTEIWSRLPGDARPER